MKLLSNERAARPTKNYISDRIWDIVQRCWAQEPSDRPACSECLEELYLELQSTVNISANRGRAPIVDNVAGQPAGEESTANVQPVAQSKRDKGKGKGKAPSIDPMSELIDDFAALATRTSTGGSVASVSRPAPELNGTVDHDGAPLRPALPPQPATQLPSVPHTDPEDSGTVARVLMVKSQKKAKLQNIFSST